jgi:hypothetical protein
MAHRDHEAKYTLSRTQAVAGWLLPLLVALVSLFGVYFARGNFGEVLRQYFFVR